MESTFAPKWLQPLGIDFFCVTRKYLVFNMVGRNLKVKYKRSILGLLWTLVSPLATAAIYYFVFEVIFQQGTPHFATFMLLGILPWSFFSATLLEGADALIGNQGLISKVPIPPQLFCWVGVLTNAVTLLISVSILIGALYFSGLPVVSNLVIFGIASFFLFLITYGFSVWVSVMAVFFRDLRHIISICVQILFYATPVLYSPNLIPEKFRWILYLNPAAAPLVLIRENFQNPVTLNVEWVGVATFWAIASLLLGFLSIRWSRHFLVENL